MVAVGMMRLRLHALTGKGESRNPGTHVKADAGAGEFPAYQVAQHCNFLLAADRLNLPLSVTSFPHSELIIRYTLPQRTKPPAPFPSAKAEISIRKIRIKAVDNVLLRVSIRI